MTIITITVSNVLTDRQIAKSIASHLEIAVGTRKAVLLHLFEELKRMDLRLNLKGMKQQV